MPGRGSGDNVLRTEVNPKAMKVIIHMRRDIHGVSIHVYILSCAKHRQVRCIAYLCCWEFYFVTQVNFSTSAPLN